MPNYAQERKNTYPEQRSSRHDFKDMCGVNSSKCEVEKHNAQHNGKDIAECLFKGNPRFLFSGGQ